MNFVIQNTKGISARVVNSSVSSKVITLGIALALVGTQGTAGADGNAISGASGQVAVVNATGNGTIASSHLVVDPVTGAVTLDSTLKFGGSTNAFPMLKRNAAGIDVRLADDSGYASLNTTSVVTGGGAASAPALGNGSSGMYFGGVTNLYFATGQAYRGGFLGANLQIGNLGSLGFEGGAGGTPAVTKLYGSTANTLEQRNGANPQAFNVYNTYTDASNYERGYFKWTSNFLNIGAEALGTGVARGIRVISGSYLQLVATGQFYLDASGNSNSTVSLRPSGTGLYSILDMQGQSGTTGLIITAATGASGYFNTDTFTFRNAASTANYLTLLAAGATFNSAVNVNATGTGAQGVPSLTIWGTSADNNWGGSLTLKSLNSSVIANIFSSTNGLLFNATGTVGTSQMKLTSAGAFSVIPTASAGANYRAGIGTDATTRTALEAYEGGVRSTAINGLNWMAGSGVSLAWCSTAAANASYMDLILTRDAANTLAQRNGTTGQTFALYSSYTDASNYIRLRMTANVGYAALVTEGAGTGGVGYYLSIGTNGAQPLYFQTANVTRWQVLATGHLLPYSTDNAYDFGSSSLRPRTGYFGTSVETTRLNARPSNAAIGWFMDDSGESANSYLAAYRYPGDWLFAANKNNAGVVKNISFAVGSDVVAGAQMVISAGAVTIATTKVLTLTACTVANLPAAATAGLGACTFVTDATVAHAGNSGTIVVGGGANNVPVYSDGTAWRIG